MGLQGLRLLLLFSVFWKAVVFIDADCEERRLISGSRYRVLNYQLTTSSLYSPKEGLCSPSQSRLNSVQTGANTDAWRTGAWCARSSTPNQWIQVDFASPFYITSIATQGRDQTDQWVTSYMIHHSNDGHKWSTYTENGNDKVFVGNWDRSSVQKHHLKEPFTARYVRLYVKTWHGHPSLRWEIYGCPLSALYEGKREYSYMDEMAQAACVGLMTGNGWMYAVRRICSSKVSCSQICSDPALYAQDTDVAKLSKGCVDSLHVEPRRPILNLKYQTDTRKVGFRVYKYNSCSPTYCGPNYCCCSAK